MPFWFVMSRRTGLLRTAAFNQVVEMGDAHSFRNAAGHLGDKILTSIIYNVNRSIPLCSDDSTVKHKYMCPEADEVTLSQGLPWIPQTSIQVMLTDPRDGPLLPWQDRDDSVTWSNKGTSQFDKCLKECCSPKECWQKVWLPRYGAGGVHMLKVPYEHMTNKPELSRHELLAHNNSYICNWMRQSGLDVCR